MQLYHHPFSPSARRVRMAAKHLGVALDLVEIDLAKADDRRRLEELDANGRVPVLVDGALVLSESCAIMQYLADHAAAVPLMYKEAARLPLDDYPHLPTWQRTTLLTESVRAAA